MRELSKLPIVYSVTGSPVLKFENSILEISAGTKAEPAAPLADSSNINEVIVKVDSTSADRTVTLPEASVSAGLKLTVSKVSNANKVTVTPYTGELIEGGATFTLLGSANYVTLVSDGTGWVVVASKLEKIVSIGTWDMDATAAVTVAHGVGTSYSLITFSTVNIINDAASAVTPLAASGSHAIDATNYTLTRTGSGTFDAATYDLTSGSYNRGFIVFSYKGV